MPEFILNDGIVIRISNPEQIRTPRLVVFEKNVEENIRIMKAYLESVAPGTGFNHMCCHVKTNKSEYVTSMLKNAGIKFFKSTLNEIEMLCSIGVEEIFIAYPVLKQDILFIADKIKKYPDIKFFVQAGTMEHIKILNNAGKEYEIRWNSFIDVDVGMHRTGISPDRVMNIYRLISESEFVSFSGLHGYDGHNDYADKGKMASEVKKSMQYLINLLYDFEKNGVKVPRIVVGGSPSFLDDFSVLYPEVHDKTDIYVSPGTWVYWDSVYNSAYPGKFVFAALVLAQIIDISDGRITLNAGHKRWGADHGSVDIFSIQGAQVFSFSEEHIVLLVNNHSDYKIGDYVLIVPKHICPTVNLYESFIIIDEEGSIKGEFPVDGRNR